MVTKPAAVPATVHIVSRSVPQTLTEIVGNHGVEVANDDCAKRKGFLSRQPKQQTRDRTFNTLQVGRHLTPNVGLGSTNLSSPLLHYDHNTSYGRHYESPGR